MHNNIFNVDLAHAEQSSAHLAQMVEARLRKMGIAPSNVARQALHVSNDYFSK